MSIINPHIGRKAEIHAEERKTMPYRYADIRGTLLDTERILPKSFTGASVDYPGPGLSHGDVLDVHVTALISKDFPAYVTEIDQDEEHLGVTISVDERGFAVAALKILVTPNRKDRGHSTIAQGSIDIIELHVPLPGLLVRAAAKRAIGSFIDKTSQNICTTTKSQG